MPLASTSYAASVSAALVTMLAASTNFETWSGHTGSPSGALAQIIEDNGGTGTPYSTNNTPVNMAINWAVVRINECDRITRALLTYGWKGTAEIQLIEAITSGDKQPEIFRRARNNAGLIAQDLQNLFFTNAAYIAGGEVTLGVSIIADITASIKGRVVTALTIDWRDVP